MEQQVVPLVSIKTEIYQPVAQQVSIRNSVVLVFQFGPNQTRYTIDIADSHGDYKVVRFFLVSFVALGPPGESLVVLVFCARVVGVLITKKNKDTPRGTIASYLRMKNHCNGSPKTILGTKNTKIYC
jgi:hypothetical protein